MAGVHLRQAEPAARAGGRLGQLSLVVLTSSVGDPFTLTVSLVLLYGRTRSPLAIPGVYGNRCWHRSYSDELTE